MINAQAGIEVNTRRVFAEAGTAGLGRMIVLNKMDAENIDFPALVENIQRDVRQGGHAPERAAGPGGRLPRRGQHAERARRHGRAPWWIPAEISQSLLESIIEVDDEVMSRYFEGQQPSDGGGLAAAGPRPWPRAR